MRKILILIIYFLPGLLPAQGQLDSAGVVRQEVEPTRRQVKQPKNNDDGKTAVDDWKKNGLFQALFHVGLNFAQIDGDAYAGYNKPGFDGGAGVLVRFHKYLSTSIEANYTMWGARFTFADKGNLYNTNLNYVQIPIAINVHEKEIFMFSAGLNFGALTQFKERNERDTIITNTVQPQPKKLDIDAFASIHFIIKKQFGIGLKFSYSMIPFRGVEPEYATLTHIHGEYNNVLTLRFMYILSAWKKK
jgi:hypothetical protein